MAWLSSLGLWIREKAVRRTPDPFVLALCLTAVCMVSALLTGFEPRGMMEAWSGGSGLWRLLRFSMQAAMMLLLGSVLAQAPRFHRALAFVAGSLPSARIMVAMTATCSICLALVNWSLSIVGGALIARECGQQARARGWQLHYPLLCAAGYSGLMVWHGGLSGTAPLKVTRAGDLQELVGVSAIEAIPLSDTIFSPLNFYVNLGLLALAFLLFFGLTPSAGQDPTATSAPELACESEDLRPSSRLQRILALFLALLLAGGCASQISKHGVARLDLNVLNLGLWSLSLFAHQGLDRWLSCVENNIRGCAGILLQFPLYAGIMGLMTQGGLAQALASWMSALNGPLLRLFTFMSAALLNVFVPSGGGQWAIQGPLLLNAAEQSGHPPAPLIMAMAYGDQLTNMIQPFWALPLLAITGVRARQISGYCLLWMFVGGSWISLILVICPN